MTATSSAGMAAVPAAQRNQPTGLKGGVVLPGEPLYDEARRVWNGMIDKHPAMIIFCEDADDAAAAVRYACANGLTIAVRSGGHNVAGHSVCDDGLVIDLSRMASVSVDPGARIAHAGAGVLIGTFDAATQAHGLATTMGVVSDTGIAGLTLGGGFGKLGRKYGLTCDNLIAVDLVTADGRKLRASTDDNPDLFWALRGGGGNFGIATGFHYRLHPVGPQVLAGSLVYDLAQTRAAIKSWYALSREAPDEVSADAALAMGEDGKPCFAVSLVHAGPMEAAEAALQPFRRQGSPIDDSIGPKTYLEVQSGGDRLFRRGRRYYWKAQFLDEIEDAAIDAMLEAYASAPSRDCLAILQQVGGAIARTPAPATAYANRSAAYDCFPVAMWDDAADDEAHVAWTQRFWSAMKPFSTGGVYANNLGEEGADRVREAYRGNYERLARIKKKYDPNNVFRLNQNIRPES